MIGQPEPTVGRAQLLAALLDEARSGVLALDADGRILHLNAAAAAIIGRQRQNLIGKPFVALLRLNGRRAFRAAVATAEISPVALEVTLLDGAGTVLPLVVRQLPGIQPTVVSVSFGADVPRPAQPDEGGRSDARTASILDHFFLRFPHGVLGISKDQRVVFANPRARKLLSDETLRLGRQLPSDGALQPFVARLLSMPSTVTVGAITLPGGRIVRATGLGARGTEPAIVMMEDITKQERQERAMREFLRNAAHQLRTPLTGIASSIQVLQAGAKDDPDARDRFLEHVEAHTQRLIRIARGLLVLARAQTGEAMRLEFVELRPLLDELARLATPADGVEIVVECDPQLAALAERDLAHEAVAAILENAVDHTHNGSIVLSAAEQNGNVEISVTDRGGGVLPEHRGRIFEPFYRPAASGERFGLGLAIAAEAVKAMDGRIHLDDVEGGTRFTVQLPSGRLVK